MQNAEEASTNFIVFGLTRPGPALEYACEVSDGCFEREVAKLEKVQLDSARIVTGLTQFASRDSLYYETGWEPLFNT
jgi:hypothetical protein